MNHFRRTFTHRAPWRRTAAALLLLCILLPARAATAHHEYRVLLLNSYNHVFAWTAGITRGVERGLEGLKHPVRLHVEYMDTKNAYGPDYLDLLARQYRLKYGKTRFDAVIASDDNAARFALDHRADLFGGAPVVFCGVNDADILGGKRPEGITGVFEAVDIAGTISSILAIQPGVRTIHLISDDTTTGRLNRDATDAVLPQFAGQAMFSWIEDTSLPELEAILATLPPDHACLFVSYTRDRTGRWYTYKEAIEHVSRASRAPVYGFWDFLLGRGDGRGIVGGVLASGERQGELAAAMAARIMDGERAEDIPLMSQDSNRAMFDYSVMQRYGLDPDRAPAGSALVNVPQSVLRRYALEISAVAVTMAVMLTTILLLLANIRGRRRAEAELAQLNHGLEEMVEERTAQLVDRSRQLERANAELTKLDELKTAVLNTVSHDLRTPLTSVLGFCKLIDRDFNKHFMPLAEENGERGDDLKNRAERIRANLAIIELEGERLTRLVNDFLDLSRIESGRSVWNDRQFDPAPLIERAGPLLHGYFADSAVSLDIDVAGPLPRIVADPDRLLQVIGNLVGNGAKFTRRGTVRLSASATDSGWLRVAVSDTGIGIPPEELARVFDTFYQVRGDTTDRRVVRGSGMGLAICRRIVEHYGGTITAQSTPGKGSVFIFTLPPAP
jgi:signal transduction histidine kinase